MLSRSSSLFAAVAVVVAGVLAAPTAWCDDDAASLERARAEADRYRLHGTLEAVGGVALLGGGTALTIAGAMPCPPSQDCSTRGLGVAIGVPIALAGLVVGALAFGDLAAASRVERAIGAGRARGASREGRQTQLASRANVQLGAGLALLGGGAATLTGVASDCGRRGSCSGTGSVAGFVGGAGLVAAGAVYVFRSERARDASDALRSVALAPSLGRGGGALTLAGTF